MFARGRLIVWPFVLIGFAGQVCADYVGVTWSGGQVFSINESTFAATPVREIGTNGHNAMAKDAQGRLWIAGTSELWVFDPATNDLMLAATLDVYDVRGLAFAPDGTLYATVLPDEPALQRLYTINVATGHATLVGLHNHIGVQGLTFAADGTLYGWGVWAGLLRISLLDGATLDVNGVDPEPDSFLQTLFVGPDGSLMGAGRNGALGTAIATVDSATGAATALGYLSMPPGLPPWANDMRGMEWIPEPASASLLALGLCCASARLRVAWRTLRIA